MAVKIAADVTASVGTDYGVGVEMLIIDEPLQLDVSVFMASSERMV